MSDLKSLIPRNKHDLDAIIAIQEAGYPAIAPILDELMEWTADGNWPVAGPLARFLSTLGEPVVDPILRVLRGDDPTFKYSCLVGIVSALPIETLRALESDLRRLTVNPSPENKAEAVHEEAEAALLRLRS
ncbi:MAG: DUF5071 domain-containing protein [Mesorhizobium sp.]|uniref:DUF5071 domain-containing protein n=1 Tax=Mesorhizobium sp. TaxID=1871066 RepID=UPI001ACB9811|nr:DUF5071 domain-containing protein [Mesorhizobium sp.]MBN9216763.1 DUF5071 domain-containing protein [Mesorhizobium sp.]